MTSYINSAFQGYLKRPISDYVISGASQVYSGVVQATSFIYPSIRPSKAMTKVFTYVPLKAIGALVSQIALFGISAKLARMAYKSATLKNRLLYGGATIFAASLGAYELFKFRNVISCFNSFECTRFASWINPESCAQKAQEAYFNCTV